MITIKQTKEINSGLKVELVNSFEQLDKYADSWDLLALNAQRQHPVMSHAWITAYFRTMVKKDESWFCLFAFDNDDLVGVLPLLTKEYKLFWNKYLLLRTPNDAHTMAVDFLFKEKYGKKAIQLFADYLNNMRPKVIRLTMNQISYNSTTFGILAGGIHGIYSCYYPNKFVSIIPVEGSFQDYKKRLSKKLIGNLRRSGNSLKELGNFSVTAINDGSDARENLLSFAGIEKSGWKGKKGATIKYNFWSFFEELVHNMVKREWLEWYFLNVDNKRIAGYLTISFGRSAFIYKTGYDEEYRSHSPGSVLTEKMIENIFSTGKYDVINFFTDYEWLLRWNVKQKPYYKLVIAFNNPLSFFSTRLRFTIYSRFPFVRRLKTFLSRFTLMLRGNKKNPR